jgi:hypothetical protein
LYESGQGQAGENAGGVDRHVAERRVPARHEMLVELVAARVEDSRGEGERPAPDRADEQHAQHRVFGEVGELAEHEVPRPEAGAEVGNRREAEDQARPEHDRYPRPEEPRGTHRPPMIGSRPIGER